MSETTYYQRNREVILNRAKEKNMKREYGKKDIITCLKKIKKRLKKYQKIIVRLKNVFYKCKYIKKNMLQNCYFKDIFCSFFY